MKFCYTGAACTTLPGRWSKTWSEGHAQWLGGKIEAPQELSRTHSRPSSLQQLQTDRKERAENICVHPASGTQFGRAAKIL